MSKKIKSKNAKYKSALLGAVAIAASFAMFVSACTTSSDDDDTTSTSTQVDEQELKNGNFEFFSDNDGTYLIGSPDNWSSGTGSGATSSDSQSGVISTTVENWNRLTDTDLPQTLMDNDKLDTDDDDYVDYNATVFDLPFSDPASAITENEDYDEDDDDSYEYFISDDATYIENPYTHNYRWVEVDGETVLYDADGNEVDYYYNEDDEKYYLDEDYTEEIESNVLMIHNYVEDDKQGTETYYTSSTTLTLEINTAAKISVWVKTSDLYFGGNNDTRTEVLDQRGAYIELTQTVGGTTIDSFIIKNINTEVLNPYDEETGTWANGNNGWVQYTLYISACDYATTTITLTVGLGESSIYTTEGYAFFDDITFEKYLSVDEMIEAAGGQDAFDSMVNDPDLTTTCTLLSDSDEKIFRVDIEQFNNGDTLVYHYSNKYTYHIDLAIASELEDGQRTDITLDEDNLTAGLTVDDDGYVSSKGNGTVSYVGSISQSEETTTYLNNDLNINIDDDILANITVTSASSWSSAIGGNYQDIIDEALSTAVDLPGSGDSASVLLMLSARGAAYESVISDESFTIAANGYKIVTMWVKTSGLDDITTVTISARQVGDTSNSGSFEVDTTTIDATTINDVEDVYNGWVQCYALISNSTDEDQEFELVVNYGVTEIKDTTFSSYYGGWVAVTNISVLEVNETAFGYADSDSLTASLSITDETTTDTQFDDTYYTNEIQTQPARPASYNGVNGASASVQSVPVEISDYDRVDNYQYAGLINRDYYDEYKEYFAELLESLDASSPLRALFGSDADWDSIVGLTVEQPLLIVNTVRTIAENTDIFNYGFIGSESTASSDSYTVVSVRVKVSEGAIATVYLVDPDTKQTLSYVTPSYTFWYDNDGNVLKGEPDDDWTKAQRQANIAYTLQDNGLYTDEDGNYYANLYNYSHEYYDERASYYDSDGNSVAFDDLVDGEIYYANSSCTEYAPHYLVTSDGDRVYCYAGTGVDSDAVYNYIVDDEVDTDIEVKTFDITVATPRYTSLESSPYSFTIDARYDDTLADKWITVSFLIHTGSEEKSYRLEVWSGTRDEQSTEGVVDGSYVLFDYSALSIDEDTYNDLLSEYTDNIISAYRAALSEADSDIVFASNDETIAYYEELAAEYNVTVDLYSYEALYYTYTLYDSLTYVPFNADTADEDESGYNYAYSDYSESLAVLKVDDSTASSEYGYMYMFIDYSTVDQSISITSTTDVEDDDDDDTDSDSTNIWLLVSSIVMVVAILIAIIVLMIKDMRRKLLRRPKVGKNTYNYKKNRRYVRTYVKEHGETKVNDTTDIDDIPGGDEIADITPLQPSAEDVREYPDSNEPETDDGNEDN